MPLCICDREIPADQKRCTYCGREQQISSPPLVTRRQDVGSNPYSKESLREVKKEAQMRKKSSLPASGKSNRESKSRTRVENFNRVGFVIAISLGVIAYLVYRSNPTDINPVLCVCAPIAAYVLWIIIYRSNTVKCPSCADLKSKGTTSTNPRKAKRRAFVGTHKRGYQDGWRTKTQRNQSQTSYQDRYGQHIGDSTTTSYSSYTVPTRTEFLSDEFHCPDCRFIWFLEYTKTYDLA